MAALFRRRTPRSTHQGVPQEKAGLQTDELEPRLAPALWVLGVPSSCNDLQEAQGHRHAEKKVFPPDLLIK